MDLHCGVRHQRGFLKHCTSTGLMRMISGFCFKRNHRALPYPIVSCSALTWLELPTTAASPAGGLTAPLFVYNSSAAGYWYNTRLLPSKQAQQQYQTAGWLAGQALHNRTVLGVRLAPLLWQKVLEGDQFQASCHFWTALFCAPMRCAWQLLTAL